MPNCNPVSPGFSPPPSPTSPPTRLPPSSSRTRCSFGGLCPLFLAGTLKGGGQSPREDRGFVPPASCVREGRVEPLFALLGAMDTGTDPMACGQS